MALISGMLGTLPITLMVPFTASAGVIITPKRHDLLQVGDLVDFGGDAEFFDGLFGELRQCLALRAAGSNNEDVA